MKGNINLNMVLQWFHALEKTFTENREWLTDLDSAIGDADHGVNMERGFKMAANALNRTLSLDLESAFKTVAVSLIQSVGGAAGPLYGTFFLRAAGLCRNKDGLAMDDLITMFEAGLTGIQERGKAMVGDKTMVDVFSPVLQSMKDSREKGKNLKEMLQGMVQEAENGMVQTIGMIARKGRASYLGDRSIGHQDPGATSAYLLIRQAAIQWG